MPSTPSYRIERTTITTMRRTPIRRMSVPRPGQLRVCRIYMSTTGRQRAKGSIRIGTGELRVEPRPPFLTRNRTLNRILSNTNSIWNRVRLPRLIDIRQGHIPPLPSAWRPKSILGEQASNLSRPLGLSETPRCMTQEISKARTREKVQCPGMLVLHRKPRFFIDSYVLYSS